MERRPSKTDVLKNQMRIQLQHSDYCICSYMGQKTDLAPCRCNTQNLGKMETAVCALKKRGVSWILWSPQVD